MNKQRTFLRAFLPALLVVSMFGFTGSAAEVQVEPMAVPTGCTYFASPPAKVGGGVGAYTWIDCSGSTTVVAVRATASIQLAGFPLVSPQSNQGISYAYVYVSSSGWCPVSGDARNWAGFEWMLAGENYWRGQDGWASSYIQC